MVWKKSDGTHVKVGKSWIDDNNIRHPTNWSIWTDAQKKAVGLTWEDDVDTSFDERFYWAKGIERKLADENVVNEDGSAVIDPMTNKQMVQLGLKSIWVARTKLTANSLLSSSDWYVVRGVEESIAIPSDISTFRDSVRKNCNTIETAINACANLDDFKALFVVPTDDNGNVTGNATIHNFPDEVK